jgi:hypothetical protein
MPARFHWRRLTLALTLGFVTTLSVAYAASLRLINLPSRSFRGYYGVGANQVEMIVVRSPLMTHRIWLPPDVGIDSDARYEVLDRTNFLGIPDALGWGEARPFHGAYPPIKWSTPSGSRRIFQRWEVAYGWPFRAVWYQGAFLADMSEHVAGASIVSSSGPGPYADDLRVVPYLPIWPGLLLNTLFYATLWSILLFAPRAIRRHLRTKHHRCPTCKYDLRNLPTAICPECGTARPGPDAR